MWQIRYLEISENLSLGFALQKVEEAAFQANVLHSALVTLQGIYKDLWIHKDS